jgi:hypothetical protein
MNWKVYKIFAYEIYFFCDIPGQVEQLSANIELRVWSYFTEECVMPFGMSYEL